MGGKASGLRASCSSAAATTRKNRLPGRRILLVPVECFGNFGLCRCFKNNPPGHRRTPSDCADLGQAFALSGVGVTPGRTAFKFVQNVISGFRGSLSGKLIPQVFHQLKALKLAKVFNGLQCGFHAAKSSTPASEWCCQQVDRNGGESWAATLSTGAGNGRESPLATHAENHHSAGPCLSP